MENRKVAGPSQFAQSSPVPQPIFRFLFSIFASLTLLAGCGAPGEPVERKAPIPTAVHDLAATQQGDEVTLTFTFPKDSVEGRELKESTYTALVTSGKAVAFTALTLVASVLFWYWSSIRFDAEMGMLLAVWMFVSMLGAMTILPVLIVTFRPKFIERESCHGMLKSGSSSS